MTPTISPQLDTDRDATTGRDIGGLRRSSAVVLATLVAVLALVAATLVPAASGPDHHGAERLGVSSMVDLLATESSTSSAMDLRTLRWSTFGMYIGEELVQGQGVDVAVIDTGVAPVDGLDAQGKVLHGPDLSSEGTVPEVAYLDTYGHGTHLAGIIAGERAGHEGLAPKARIVSVKVAGHDGVTTVPQVVAAIDWVIDHRNADGLNIRVLNLSLGQAGVTSHVGDPLSAAVERAWDAGIFVVVAAGNRGAAQAHLDSPAISPRVLAVGATEATTTNEYSLSRYPGDYSQVASWSAHGDTNRNPDVVALGRSIASYRVPGSTIDELAPNARYGTDLFLGSGSSQSAAITSGLAAAVIADNPALSPDDVKATLLAHSEAIDWTAAHLQGTGALNGYDTMYGYPQSGQPSTAPRAAGAGTGLAAPSGATWSGGTWSGATWSGATWSGTTWSGGTWSGATWSGATWSGATWSGATWSGGTWSGATWSGGTWSGATWSGGTWSGNGWS